MTDVYLCQQGDSLKKICSSKTIETINKRTSQGNSSFEDRLKHIEEMNPKLPAGTAKLSSGDIVFLSDEPAQSLTRLHLNASLTHSSRQNLTQITDKMGGNQTVALALLLEKYKTEMADLNTFGGAGLGAAATRSSNFLQALDRYDRAIQKFESLRHHRAAPATMARAKTAINEAYKHLQIKFNLELQNVQNTYVSKTSTSKMHYGTTKQRTIYRSMPVRSASTARSLANFGRHAKILGPGAILADGYFRYDSVMDSYNTGGNWKQEAFAQGAGFSAGITVGFIGMTFMLGPLGWVLGIILVGTCALIIDRSVVSLGRKLYDVAY